MMKIKHIVLYGLLIAIMCIATIMIVIPLPTGFINLSDALILLFANVLPYTGIVAVAGIGCALADILAGYGQYAIFTFFIKSIEGILVIYLLSKWKFKGKTLIAYLIGVLVMLVGYGLTDSLLMSSIYYFPVSFLANSTQAIACIILAMLLLPLFKLFLNKIKNYL